MRAMRFGLLLGVCVLASCDQGAASPAGTRSPGRYAGIGTFDAGRLWQEMKGAPTQDDQAAAKLADDEHVIVVLDSHSGEVRECGDHSGFCIAMNPWTSDASKTVAPVKLTKHAADVASEGEKASGTGGAANEATPTH